MAQLPVTVPQQRETDRDPDAGVEPAAPIACPACGSVRLTSLAMTLTDGTPVSFTSCRACEHRAWNHEGGALALADVLTRTRKQL
jgi:formate dehydrogenase maturation protein FdhE